MPSDSATSAACIGPPPPKATSANSRGSWPFWTVRERIAPDMFAFAIVTIPSAASSSGRPSSSAEPLHGGDGGVAVELHLAAEEAVGVDAAEHDVRVGRASAPARRGRSRPGRGSRRRCAARRGRRRPRRRRRSSRRRRRSCGCRSSARAADSPATQVSRAEASLIPRSVTIPMSAEVPPTSKVISCLRPVVSPAQSPPSTPAAGPGEEQRHGLLRPPSRPRRRRRSTSSRAASRARPRSARAPASRSR